MSEKIQSHHLERKAVLYIRQSTAFQMQNNLESQRLQYGMETRLRELGWRDIEVIDEDLGRSAAGGVGTIGLRADGRGSLLRPGRSGSGAGSVALCAKQPRMATVG